MRVVAINDSRSRTGEPPNRVRAKSPPNPAYERQERIEHHCLHGEDSRADYWERQPHAGRLLRLLADSSSSADAQRARQLALALWRYWSGWERAKVVSLLDARARLWRDARDPRVSEVPDRRRVVVNRGVRLLVKFDAGVQAGLAARLNTYLEHGLCPGGSPELVFYAGVCLDRDVTRLVLERLCPVAILPTTPKVRVCPGCKVVFEPRRPDHRRCEHCRHKLAAPASDGTDAAFRVPRLLPGMMITAGWKTARIKACATCGERFLARDGKELHCQAHRR
jgi:hypothetical protein